MSARRVVEYLVVAGIVERKGSEASITSKLVRTPQHRFAYSKSNDRNVLLPSRTFAGHSRT